MKPFYEKGGIILYNCDCRSMLLSLFGNRMAVVMDPPWDENPMLARELVLDLTMKMPEVITFWGQSGPPNSFTPLVAIYTWTHFSTGRLHDQKIYHFAEDATTRISASMSCPDDPALSHPAQKPVALMEALIKKTADLPILDPFCGSGTTLVAAQRLGRNAIGFEIEERYTEIAARRIDAIS